MASGLSDEMKARRLVLLMISGGAVLRQCRAEVARAVAPA
jgi:hypothetical protein